jgi:nucleoside-diphosphate-sugar epimerase
MILVTGASGFVGGALYKTLAQSNSLRISIRNMRIANQFNNVDIVEGSLSSEENWTNALSEISVVIHCAARVHVMDEKASDPLTEFRRVNVEGTLNLARQAYEAGVHRFIFLSSAKVYGGRTQPGHPFGPDEIVAPDDPYAISKYEAEILLRSLSKETGMEVVIIRTPLVYGPGVKANFFTMMKWIWRGIPLPFGGITKNRRSFIFIDNLVSMIVTCINHPAAANQTFVVSDDEDLSTAELFERIALALGRPSKLIAVPAILIILGAKLVGRADISQRLCGSLQVDIKKTKDLLGWTPPVSVDEGLRQTAASFLKISL